MGKGTKSNHKINLSKHTMHILARHELHHELLILLFHLYRCTNSMKCRDETGLKKNNTV